MLVSFGVIQKLRIRSFGRSATFRPTRRPSKKTSRASNNEKGQLTPVGIALLLETASVGCLGGLSRCRSLYKRNRMSSSSFAGVRERETHK